MPWADAARWDTGNAFDGKWETPLAGRQEVIEPANGKVLWHTGVGNAADMLAAIGRAQAAWVATGPRERSEILLNAAAQFEQHFDELDLVIARETGSILAKGQHEVREAISLFRIAARLPMQAQGQVLPCPPGRMSLARRGCQVERHPALRAVLRPPRFIQGKHVLHGRAAGQVRGVCGFTGQQRCVEAELRPYLRADVAGAPASAIGRHQRDAAIPARCAVMAHSGKVSVPRVGGAWSSFR
ncbi:TPA: aldehyde dehydrogenase family protein [Stenotrophomonas maltophilia]|nr:aldehyde dehydrogenase family protein [Stenotrophomonas maltophilia]HEJ3239976.1 aldehyde dehydrogenase family protein [Pseudomonas aeruginosa]HDS1372586.1 aldehyde dehydrogenase family protein [Stenotrophomonas maltophilia]HDS1376511.1 aldehyde dehydrogenase family protein [Stenotrophomonas maltophilia]HDS1381365.1 aldehyde dehydrogenase family protein [Stenotrophomonas maltophilia]